MSIVSVDRSQARHYEANGRRYFGVTTICHAMEGLPAFGSEQDLKRGSDLHTIFALAVASYAGKCAPPAVPDDYTGYYQSMRHWIETYKPNPILQEQSSVCPIRG